MSWGQSSEEHWALPHTVQLLKGITFRGWFEGMSLHPSSLLNPSSSAQKAWEQEVWYQDKGGGAGEVKLTRSCLKLEVLVAIHAQYIFDMLCRSTMYRQAGAFKWFIGMWVLTKPLCTCLTLIRILEVSPSAVIFSTHVTAGKPGVKHLSLCFNSRFM